ncbi:negative regulator of sigma-B (phosphoserine phosphatase) [Scopulibacillus darangshiensis]|uniref:Negative regulator of sigma-B (Phosphoserine phosphatase) n=1 Tax=Scopulibacillus darangshiensis TaxID=442528 RepID=A0A4R2NPT1_9BACL|nr:PP2C family serine/threonine-protein phosphatase [Scopulibacillus darangshiensis]TCP23833.1 negative regulator of sigma-B (phosphoserine phosphatase) [Scopulibacillus darangshiensis]
MIEYYPFDKFKVSAIQKAKRDKPCCGDSYYVKETDDYLICAVADGLGSGIGAKEASQKVVDTVRNHHELPVETQMLKANLSLHNERGAVVTIFKIDYKKGLVTYCGVGNIRLSIYPKQGKSITPLSKPGFLSGRPVRFHVQEFAYPEGGLFVIHSDGVNILSQQLPVIRHIYSADRPDQAEDYFNDLMQGNGDDVTLLIGKPLC